MILGWICEGLYSALKVQVWIHNWLMVFSVIESSWPRTSRLVFWGPKTMTSAFLCIELDKILAHPLINLLDTLAQQLQWTAVIWWHCNVKLFVIMVRDVIVFHDLCQWEHIDIEQSGPGMEPWGTPNFILVQLDSQITKRDKHVTIFEVRF